MHRGVLEGTRVLISQGDYITKAEGGLRINAESRVAGEWYGQSAKNRQGCLQKRL